ncbi:MAG TPA: hypothetical protein VG755_33065 [Nannocystaceae bacterium]|nr:hypothetical protein [Nannocystaceae bacterium]
MRSAALFSVLCVGCAHGELVASNGEHRLTARDADSGVTIVLTTGAWDGQPQQLDDEITVIHALVANMGDQPILLAPGDLDLRDVRGFRYDLLDTGASFVRVESDESVAEGYDRQLERSYDPGRSLAFEPFLVSGDAAPRALPWGVLEPGTQMRGFLYFEPVTRTANGTKLTWHIDTPEHASVMDAVFELAVAR